MEALMNAAVDHVTVKAPFYFDFVRGHNKRGVVWLVLVVKDDATAALGVKSLSFLPVEAVELGDSAALMRMYDTYDVDSQFLCWYTIEGAHGRPLYSRVVVVDSAAGHDASHIADRSLVAEPQHRTPHASAAAHPPISARSDPAFQSLPSPSSNVRAAPHSPPRPQASLPHDAYTDPPQHHPHENTPLAEHVSGTHLPMHASAAVEATAPARPASLAARREEHAAAPADYSHLMRMMLEVADAAGKTSRAVEELNAKVMELAERQNVIDQGMAAVLTDSRTAFLENKVAQLEATVRELQTQRGAPAPQAAPAGDERARVLEGRVAGLEEALHGVLRRLAVGGPQARAAPVQPPPAVAPEVCAQEAGGAFGAHGRESVGVIGGVGVRPASPAAHHDPHQQATPCSEASPPLQPQPQPQPQPSSSTRVDAPPGRCALDDMISKFEAKLNAMARPGAGDALG